MVITPGVSSLPDSGKDSFDCTCSAVPSEKTLSPVRIFSRSRYAAEAPSICGQPTSSRDVNRGLA